MTVALPDAGDLAQAHDQASYGGKAVQLGAAVRAGLPVPPGVALSAALVGSVAASGDGSDVVAACAALLDSGGPLAVRSSAIGEDSASASFAGAHKTVLGVRGAERLVQAVLEVHASAFDGGALAYRDRMGIEDAATMSGVTGSGVMGVVVQQLVLADVAGVLFTRNPVSGAEERVIEASWGLGEAVVSGLVTPDHFVVSTSGCVVSRVPGEKDVELCWGADGVDERPVAAPLVEELCLSERQLVALHELALHCDVVYGSTAHDIEFAFAGDRLHLLQRRPITHG